MNIGKLTALLFVAGLASTAAAADNCDTLRILHTNDTHSIIDPYHANGLGGVARRKALIDSVRAEHPDVLLVDAGDALQGSLYFTLFGGEVEQKVMNALGYDIQILGNHEFDNGMEALEKYISGLKSKKLATNYDLSSTSLGRYFSPYTVVETPGGHRVGFLAINIEPAGLIDSAKSVGVVYLDAIKAANAMAWYLKHIEKADKVVAISHIGYDGEGPVSDRVIAGNTENIDIIIGGHSHSVVDPADPDGLQSRFVNLAGDTVLVAQTGKYGANVGEVTLDFCSGAATSKLIPVNSRLDNRFDAQLTNLLAPYKQPVDSILGIKLSVATSDFDKKPALMNWMADFIFDDARRLTNKKIDMAIVNVGGIRSTFPAGPITKGEIMQTFPFDNYEVVLEISGRDLIATMDSIAAHGGNGVSRNVSATIDPAARRCVTLTVGGKPVDPDNTYHVATINYLTGGNDGMEPLRNGRVIARSDSYLYDDMIRAFESGRLKGKKQRPDMTVRMKQVR